MKKIIFTFIVFISLIGCSNDDDEKLSCEEIITSYNNALLAYKGFPSLDNCETLDEASVRYVNSVCEKKEEIEIPNCNPYLLNINFQFLVDMSLPQYSPLEFPSNPVYVDGPNYGNAGVIIINTGSGSYRAFDAADPNHPPSACSILVINGIEGTCGCSDENSYNLFTGQPLLDGLQYPLLEYRVMNNGNGTLTVSN